MNAARTFDDVDAIMMVMERAFDPHWGEAWNRRQITDSLAMPGMGHRIALDDSAENENGTTPQPTGFTFWRMAPGEAELLLIAVLPEYRGRGIGRTLLDRLVEDCRTAGAERIFLEVRANNPAQSVYLRHGFQPIGRRKDYYRLADGTRIDAITLGRET